MGITLERYEELNAMFKAKWNYGTPVKFESEDEEREFWAESDRRQKERIEQENLREKQERLEKSRLKIISRDQINTEGEFPDIDTVTDEEAKNLAKAFKLGDSFGFLIYGNTGAGKTYFLQSIAGLIAREIVVREEYPERYITYLPMFRLVQKLRMFGKSRDEDEVLEAAESVPFLFIDDLGVEHTSDFIKEGLFAIIDSRYQMKLPTFITTNLNLNDLGEKYGQRFVSRLKEMTVPIHFKGQDRRGAMLKSNIEILKERMRGEA